MKNETNEDRQNAQGYRIYNCQEGTNLSILTLNVTSPNIQTKHERGVNWIKKQEPSVCCPQGNISHPQSQTQRQGKREEETF